VLFGLVWLPVPRAVIRRKGFFVLIVAGLALALGSWWGSEWMPVTWDPVGLYTLPVKAANVVGGMGFLAAALFFLQRYRRQSNADDLVFTCVTVLFGMASLFFSVSHTWAADWWVTHVFRLLAYAVLLAAAYRVIVGLYHHIAEYAQELEGRVHERTAELATANAYLENLFNYANAPIIVWNPQFRITRFNRAFESLTGRKAADVIGQPIEILFPPAEVASSMELIRHTLVGERWETVEIAILHVDRTVRTVLWNSANVLEADGLTPVATIAQGADITERKRAEEALKRSEAFLGNVFDHSPSSQWISDESGTLIKQNQACRELFNITDEEVVGKYNLFQDEILEKQGCMPLVRAVFERGEKANFTLKYATEDLHRLDLQQKASLVLEVIISPVKHGDGKVENAVVQHIDITERTRAEDALRASEREFRETLRHLDEGYYSVTPDGLILDHNLAFNRILGLDVALDMRGRHTPDFWLNPEDRQAYLNELMTNGLLRNYLANVKTATGQKVAVLLNSHLEKDEQGGLVRIVGTFSDFTERQRAEEALRESAARYRTLVENIPQKVFVKDREFRWVSINENLARDLGMRPEDVVGKVDADLFPKELADKYRADDTRIMETGKGEELEERYLQEGRETWVQTRKTPMRNADGEIVGVCGVFADITARKLAEEALLEANERLESRVLERTAELARSKELLAETGRLARVGGWEIDLKKNELSWTDVVYQIHEVGPEFRPTVATGIQFYAPEAVPVITEAVRRGIEDGEPWDLELPLITAKGNRLWVRAIGQGYRENGVVVRVGGVFHDITARKLADDELKKHRDHLEELVNERTAELAKAIQDLERSNKELEQFAYVASHDLQEPLRMVSSYTQLLGQRYEGQLDEKAKKYIDYAVDGAIRMQRLINDLLTYSRVGTRGKPLEPTDAHAVLGEAVVNLAAAIEESGAMITNDDLPTVRTDASQLVQVFQNLLANAIKFRGAEPPRVHVSARDQGREWVFAVRDNGIGIERQYAARVFVIFQRLHTRQEYPGTGIGLALCKRIVERHGGHIWFESEPGTGSTFFFTVPK
jgi:PAS domain S-box-containing protein